jgi:hypothetical protein
MNPFLLSGATKNRKISIPKFCRVARFFDPKNAAPRDSASHFCLCTPGFSKIDTWSRILSVAKKFDLLSSGIVIRPLQERFTTKKIRAITWKLDHFKNLKTNIYVNKHDSLLLIMSQCKWKLLQCCQIFLGLRTYINQILLLPNYSCSGIFKIEFFLQIAFY